MKNFLQGICYFLFKCVMGIYVTIFQHVRFNKNKIKLPRKQQSCFYLIIILIGILFI